MIWPELHIENNSQYAATLKFYMDNDSNDEYMIQAVDSVEDGIAALILNMEIIAENYQSGFDDGYCNGYDDALDDFNEGQLNK